MKTSQTQLLGFYTKDSKVRPIVAPSGHSGSSHMAKPGKLQFHSEEVYFLKDREPVFKAGDPLTYPKRCMWCQWWYANSVGPDGFCNSLMIHPHKFDRCDSYQPRGMSKEQFVQWLDREGYGKHSGRGHNPGENFYDNQYEMYKLLKDHPEGVNTLDIAKHLGMKDDDALEFMNSRARIYPANFIKEKVGCVYVWKVKDDPVAAQPTDLGNKRDLTKARSTAIRFVESPNGIYKCSFCGAEKGKMTQWQHPSGKVLNLCFRGCQHFGEPFRDSGAGMEGWHRVDPWQGVKKELKGLQHPRGY